MLYPDDEIEVAAAALYRACPTVKPTWEQLEDVTKSVWREYAELRLLFGDPIPSPGGGS